MKKLYFLTAAILVAGMAFAQKTLAQEKLGIERFSLEVNVGFPIHWTNGLHDDPENEDNKIEDKSVTANTAIGLAANLNFNRTFGLILDTDFSFGGKLAGYASPTSDYISLSGVNIFLGPVMYLYNSGALRVPLALGFHMYFFGDNLWIPDLGTNGAWLSRQDFQFGPGLSLGIQYHFNTGIYMFSRTGVTVDFIRVHSMKKSDGSALTKEYHSDISPNWSVKPSLGIGIKF